MFFVILDQAKLTGYDLTNIAHEKSGHFVNDTNIQFLSVRFGGSVVTSDMREHANIAENAFGAAAFAMKLSSQMQSKTFIAGFTVFHCYLKTNSE